MSDLKQSAISIFLIQALDKNKYKEIIVYADDERQARTAASLISHPEKVPMPALTDPQDSVYLNSGMSICIQTEPNILNPDNGSGRVRIKYNEVIYDLTKNIAQEVIAEKFL